MLRAITRINLARVGPAQCFMLPGAVDHVGPRFGGFCDGTTLFSVRQPAVWVTVSEIGLAKVFLAMAFFIAPRVRALT